MIQCKTAGCGSYALNISEESGLCDVCYYKTPLLDILARVHGDGGHYTDEHGIDKAVADADVIISNLMMVAEEAISWCMEERPFGWTEEEFLNNPTINTHDNNTSHLVKAVAALIQARREKRNETVQNSRMR